MRCICMTVVFIRVVGIWLSIDALISGCAFRVLCQTQVALLCCTSETFRRRESDGRSSRTKQSVITDLTLSTPTRPSAYLDEFVYPHDQDYPQSGKDVHEAESKSGYAGYQQLKHFQTTATNARAHLHVYLPNAFSATASDDARTVTNVKATCKTILKPYTVSAFNAC